MKGSAKFYKVPSLTIEGKSYQVIKMPNGSWRCNCPHFVFREKKCNHIRQVQHLKVKKNEK